MSKLEEALALQSSGKLDAAKAIFEELLEANSEDFEAHYNLGLIFYRKNDFDQAIAHLERATSINPSDVGALNNLGVVYKRAKKYLKAVVAYDEALKLDPNYVDAHSNLSNLYREMGANDKAILAAQTALKIDDKHLTSWVNLGIVYQKMGQFAKAIDHFKTALTINPKHSPAYFNLGNTLYDQKRYLEAAQMMQQALKIHPNNTDYLNNFGVMLKMLKRYDDAVKVYEAVLQIKPNSANTYNNMGLALKELRRLDEAEASCLKAIELNPDDYNAYNNLGTIYEDRHELVRAEENFNKAIALQPDHTNANWNLSVVELNLGKFEQGWKRYEWRWKSEDSKAKPRFPVPEWRGESLKGKTILVYSEQGFGDAIHFIRYIPMVKELGAKKIIVQAKKELHPLFKHIKAIDKLVTTVDDDMPVFHTHIPMLSLPLRFNTTLETIPNEVPYLFTRGKPVKLKLNQAKLNIGIVWSGSPTHKRHTERFVGLKLFEKLFPIPNVQFYSLQVGEDAEAIKTNNFSSKIIDLSSKLTDFAKTASVIKQLDLIIGSDTSVLHLAGALGKRGWVFIQQINDWRWMQEREDSPWYPTLTLFRQQNYGDWESVMDRVHDKLRDEVDMLRQRK
jgi:tetratricopeptide (TPR) repeat protein